MYFEKFEKRSEAMKREKFFKTGKGRMELQKILSGS
jgi:predicted GIY-YIG superfamily endonuclease